MVKKRRGARESGSRRGAKGTRTHRTRARTYCTVRSVQYLPGSTTGAGAGAAIPGTSR